MMAEDGIRPARKVSVTVTIPPWVYDALLAYCQENNVLRSVAIARLIEHGLQCDAMNAPNQW